MSQSAGGLFLQVKLDTAGAERQLRNLGREFSRQVDPAKMSRAAAQSAAATARTATQELKTQAAEAKAAGQAAAANATVQSASIKQQIADQKAIVEQQKIQVRQQAAAATSTNTQTRAATALRLEHERTSRVLLNDQLAQRRRQQNEQLKEQTRLLREARREAERLAKAPGSIGQAKNMLGAGAQDLFVGVGAARSGNVGYGLAAMTRYLQSMSSAAAGASVAVIGTTAAVAAIAVAAGVSAVAIGSLTEKFVRMGVEGAASFELLRIQLGGLLGSAAKGEAEFDWLIELGKTSIVPTESIIAADRQLLAFGVTADKTRRQLVEFISDLGSAMSASEEQVYFLSLAISQIVAKGKADAVDLRQLANVGVSSAKLFAIIAEQTGKSISQVQASVSEGALTSGLVLDALIAYQTQLARTADAASQSVSGLSQNIKDSFTAALSNAFLKGGVLKPIQEFLASLAQSIQRNAGLFDNLAAAAREFFSVLLGDGAGTSVGGVIDWVFRQLLPSALNAATDAVRFLQAVMRELVQDFGPLVQQVRQMVADMALWAPVIALVVSYFQVLLGVLAASLKVTATIGVLLVGTFTAAAYAIQAVVRVLQGDFIGAFQSIENGLVTLTAMALRVQAIWTGTASAANRASGRSEGEHSGGRIGDESGTGSNTTRIWVPDAAGSENAVRQASAAATRIAQARDQLFQLLRELFGRPSQVLAGLFGDADTFEATVDSIISTATQLRDALVQIVPESSPLVAWFDAEVQQLAALASERDGILKQIDAAQSQLDDLIRERNALISQIKQQAQSFVFSLNVGTTDTYTKLDNSGSFSKVTGPASFADSVKKRLAEYKDFVKNIRALEKAGLDKDIIRGLLEAGPEAAGKIAAQIAAGGSGVISDLNAAQAELRKISQEFGVEQGNFFYQEGISQATELIKGLKKRQKDVEDAAKTIVDRILDRIRPLAARLRTAGSDAGSALGAGLGGHWETITNDVSDFAGGIPDAFVTGFGSFDPIEATARGIVKAFIDELGGPGVATALLAAGANIIKTLFTGVYGSITTAVGQLGKWFSELPGKIEKWFDENGMGTVWSPLVDSIPTWDDIATVLLGALGPVGKTIAGVKQTIERTDLWESLTGDLPSGRDIRIKLGAVFNSAVTYIKTLPATLAKAIPGGSLWGFLLTGIPTYTVIVSKLSSFPKAFAAVMNVVIRAWNALDFGIDITIPDWVKWVPGMGNLAGARFKIGDIFPDVAPISLATGGIAKAPTLAVVGDAPRSSGELVAPLPPGFNIADLSKPSSTYTEVRVFIGDQELTDIVRTEVRTIDTATRTRLVAGRR